MAQLGELPLANLAAVRLDAQVDPGVLGQVRGVRERLRALGALVRLRLAHVDLRVELQVRLATEDLQITKLGQHVRRVRTLGKFEMDTIATSIRPSLNLKFL